MSARVDVTLAILQENPYGARAQALLISQMVLLFFWTALYLTQNTIIADNASIWFPAIYIAGIPMASAAGALVAVAFVKSSAARVSALVVSQAWLGVMVCGSAARGELILLADTLWSCDFKTPADNNTRCLIKDGNIPAFFALLSVGLATFVVLILDGMRKNTIAKETARLRKTASLKSDIETTTEVLRHLVAKAGGSKRTTSGKLGAVRDRVEAAKIRASIKRAAVATWLAERKDAFAWAAKVTAACILINYICFGSSKEGTLGSYMFFLIVTIVSASAYIFNSGRPAPATNAAGRAIQRIHRAKGWGKLVGAALGIAALVLVLLGSYICYMNETRFMDPICGTSRSKAVDLVLVITAIAIPYFLAFSDNPDTLFITAVVCVLIIIFWQILFCYNVTINLPDAEEFKICDSLTPWGDEHNTFTTWLYFFAIGGILVLAFRIRRRNQSSDAPPIVVKRPVASVPPGEAVVEPEYDGVDLSFARRRGVAMGAVRTEAMASDSDEV